MNNLRLTLTRILLLATGCFMCSHTHAAQPTRATGDATTAEQVQSAGEPTTLAEGLQSVADASAKKLPPQMLETFQQGIETVRSSGIERSARNIGEMAVDAKLSSWKGDPVQLSSLWKEGPVVLMWYRGGW